VELVFTRNTSKDVASESVGTYQPQEHRKSLVDETRGVTFSPEEIATMANAYELAKRKLHDRGQPPARL